MADVVVGGGAGADKLAWQPNPAGRGRMNAYVCPECEGVTVAIHEEDVPGVTPFLVGCRVTPEQFSLDALLGAPLDRSATLDTYAAQLARLAKDAAAALQGFAARVDELLDPAFEEGRELGGRAPASERHETEARS